MLDPNQMKIDSLQNQLDFLEALYNRHIHWAKDTGNIDVKSKHLNIADTLHQLTDEYEFLLKFYDQNRE